jgi:RimJ/RimL family protein N-acetyltransferase
MTLAPGTDQLESARLVLRRIVPDDLPFFTRLHTLPEVAQHLYPEGRPRSAEETTTWLQYTLASYAQFALGYLAVVRKEDGALIGRCGLMDMVVELGYTFDPAVWGQGFATEAACCVRDYARDVLWLPYTVSAILPQNARSRRVAERSGARPDGQMHVVGLAWDRWRCPLATSGTVSRRPRECMIRP